MCKFARGQHSVEFLSAGLFMPWGSDRVAESSQTFFEEAYIGYGLCPFIHQESRGRLIAGGRRDNWQTVLTITLIKREQPYSVNAGIFVLPVLCGEQGAESVNGDLASEGP